MPPTACAASSKYSHDGLLSPMRPITSPVLKPLFDKASARYETLLLYSFQVISFHIPRSLSRRATVSGIETDLCLRILGRVL